MIHALVGSFFGNWLYWQAAALAHNLGLWLRTLACPGCCAGPGANGCGWGSSTSRPAWCHGRRPHLRFAAAYPHLAAFTAALDRLRALPAFG